MTPFVRLALLASTALVAHPALAATAAPPPASAGPGDPAAAPAPGDAPTDRSAADTSAAGTGQRASGDEIVVTARHRVETAQNVPLAISVIGGEHIDNTGAFNVGRLQQLTPTLQYYSSNSRNTSVNIRGFGAPLGLTNDGIDQGVGIYVDDVYYSRVASSTFDFLDVAQIEVLRGPQGTLYGKNTTAGAINITSRQPTFEPEGRLEVSIGNYGYVQMKGAASGPLSDTLALRLAASETVRNGTIRNITTGGRDNDLSNTGLRGQLLWRPASNLDVSFAGDWNRQNVDCCATVFVKYVPTQKALNRQYPAVTAAEGYALPATAQDPRNRLTDLDAPLGAKQSLGGASLRAKLNLGAGTITSISAYRFWNWSPSNDRDFTGLPITTISQNPSKQYQWTQELRYNRHSDKLDFQIGTFYYYQHIDTNGSQRQGPAASRFLLNPGTLAQVPVGATGCGPSASNKLACTPSVLDGLTATNTIGLRNTSFSVYGQASWRPVPGLTIQPGVRVNYDKKTGSYDSVVTDGAGNVLSAGLVTTGTATQKAQLGVLLPESYTGRYSKWNVSYDLTLSYDVTRDIHVYATYSKTFQTGGINLNGVPADAVSGLPLLQFATIKPESVRSYEAGVKSQFFGRLLTLNLAAFRTEITDYQAIFSANNAQSLSTLRGYVDNVPKVRSQGIEADFSARPSERLSTYVNFAYTDATYRKFPDAPPPLELTGGATFSSTQGCALPTPAGTNVSPTGCDLAGARLPGVSKYALSFGGEANLPVAIGGRDGQAYVGAEGNWRTRFSSNATSSASTDIKGYTLVNFRAGWRSGLSASGFSVDVYGWVRNAFNVHYLELLQIGPNSTGLVVGNLGDPRTYGGTLRLTF